MELYPATTLKGIVDLPADKSISHRAALLAAIADGTTVIDNYAASEDCAATLRCIEGLGARVHRENTRVTVTGRGQAGLSKPVSPLDCGNSGTTMRLIAGILAGQPFDSILTGDDSLRSRPMRRIIEPLGAMGAAVDSLDGRPPLTIFGTRSLSAIRYDMPVSSAQVKSCVLLAALFAGGGTSVTEYVPTRDHTERMLGWFGVHILERQGEGGTVLSVNGPGKLVARDLRVPNDISAAAFFLVAAACLPGSDITMRNVGLNPTRRAIVDLLLGLGVEIEISDEQHDCNEPSGTIRILGGMRPPPRPLVIRAERTAALIDEIPILAVLGTVLAGGIEVRDAAELRVKESDRIAMVAENLRRMGSSIEEYDDGFRVLPGGLTGAHIETHGDHRIAMAFAIAALIAEGVTTIDDPDCAGVSFPGFFRALGEVAR